MLSLTYRTRRKVSSLLILAILASFWATVPSKAEAGIFDTVKSVSKTLFVQAGALATAYMGGVLGIALGGGPLGMVAGGVGGYLLGKKVMTWATSSGMNVATLLGAVGGGLLCCGMGFPVLAIGVVGGALIARGVAWLFKKITGKANTTVQVPAVQENNAQAFINSLQSQPAVTPTPVTPPPAAAPAPQQTTTVADAYDKYLSAYKNYMAATSAGDTAGAQKAFADYQKYLGDYNALLKSGAK